MQWKTDSVSANNSWQGRSSRAIPLEEGKDKYYGADYGGLDLVRMREGGQTCRNVRNNMAQGTEAGTTACGANGGTMLRRVVEGVGQSGNGAGGG